MATTLAKVEIKDMPKSKIIDITLPNGDNYRLTCGENYIDVNSTNSFEGREVVVRPRVSNEVRVTCVPAEMLP